MRFDRDHDGAVAIALTERGMCVTITAGVRIGRGTRIHFLGGSLEIAAYATLGESVNLRPSSAITVGAHATIDDFAQLQADAAPILVGASAASRGSGRTTRRSRSAMRP